MSELICTCHCGGTMFYRHLHASGCACATQGDEAPESHPDNIAALRATITQQAQEIERLKLKEAELGELKLRLNCPMLAPSCLVCGQVKPFAIRHLEAHAIGVCGECRSASQQLAAMTAERDEACGELLVSLDDAPIGSLAGKLVTANRVLRSHLATLQATLAAREAKYQKTISESIDQIDLQCDEFNRIKAITDNEEIKGICDRAVRDIGQRVPVIQQRDAAVQDAARLREAAQNLTCEVCKLDMQRALKGV